MSYMYGHPGPVPGAPGYGSVPVPVAGAPGSGPGHGFAPGPPGPLGGRCVLRAPLGSPLSALAQTPLAPHLAQILAQAPYLAQPGGLTPPGGNGTAGGEGGGGVIPLPPRIPGMPEMPPPPAGMFGGGPTSGGLLGATAPVLVPQWFIEQQQRLQQQWQPGYSLP